MIRTKWLIIPLRVGAIILSTAVLPKSVKVWVRNALWIAYCDVPDVELTGGYSKLLYAGMVLTRSWPQR